jgi:hypothetical protein
MNLKDAVAILNENDFEFSKWEIENGEAVCVNDRNLNLTPRIAIAIARIFWLDGRPVPARPVIGGVSLTTKQHFDPQTGALTKMLTYSVQASAADATVASRSLSYTTAPAAGPVSAPTVNDISVGVTCNPLDAVVVTLTDTGTDGIASQPSAPFSFTAAAGPLPVGPVTPSITGVTQTS